MSLYNRANRVGDFHGLGLFRNDILPGAGLWIVKDNLAVGRVVICLHQKLIAHVIDHAIFIVTDISHDRCERFLVFGKVAEEN